MSRGSKSTRPAKRPLTRSEIMSRVGKADTEPEMRLRRALWARGYRYRLRLRLPGTPDLVFPSGKVAVFVDGCFWHGCPVHYRTPGTNAAFWDAKIRRNQERDRRADRELRATGWVVVRLWSHQIKEDPEGALEVVAEALGN